MTQIPDNPEITRAMLWGVPPWLGDEPFGDTEPFAVYDPDDNDCEEE